VTILAIFSLKLFLAIFSLKKEKFATKYSFFKVATKKKFQRKKEREKARRQFFFFLGCELSEKFWKILGNFFLLNVNSTKNCNFEKNIAIFSNPQN
jgi:hypothetical protein